MMVGAPASYGLHSERVLPGIGAWVAVDVRVGLSVQVNIAVPYHAMFWSDVCLSVEI